ncbi:MAG: reverse transcriptase domain-containing protein [Henriciella sp.]|uniref:reverse transcriptase domain-containing protein n=1 Tax=Henriciella sp. TaxID=1968823 RepID=UPI0032EF77AE
MLSVEEAVAKAIKHVRDQQCLDDIFRPPFLKVPHECSYLEDEAFRNSICKDAEKFLLKKKISHLKKPEKFNIPKSRYAYRHASLIDVADLIKYTALTLTMADTIEASRIPKSKTAVFSYRYNKIGPIFSKKNTIDKFRSTSSSLSASKNYNVKVEADISNFYDRLNLHRLESVLAQIGCESKLVQLLNDFLLTWAGRNSFGLPVGCDASRLLAEAALINVDNGLQTEGIRFVRYVDDIRMFASSYAEAHSQLNCLVTLLDREGLFLNTLKTKILPINGKGQAPDEGEVPANAAVAEGFQKIDITEKIPAFVATGGKYPKISKVYKKPGVEAVKDLQAVDLDEILNVILNNEVTESTLRNFVKAYIYKFDKNIPLIFEAIHRYIHMCAYVVDALLAESDRFSPKERKELAEAFSKFYFDHKKSEYYDLMIVRLLSSKEFAVKDFFLKAISKMPVTVNPVYLQQFVLMGSESFERPEILKLQELYSSQHVFVRRAIFHVYVDSASILPAEKKAWAKMLSKSETDDFVKRRAAQVGYN